MYRYLTILVISVAVLSRLLLCWENPPGNSFDDHYQPISQILTTGHLPNQDDCFQCYNPPVYYLSSALFAQVLIKTGMTPDAITKALQFLNCLYSILNLMVLYLILRRLHFSETSRFLAFSIVCFLPRQLYMAAIHSNDNLSYLAVSLCAYLLLVTIDKKLNWPFAVLLSIIVTLAIFVKYTCYVVLPMVAVPMTTLTIRRSTIPRRKAVRALLIVLIPPLFLLGCYLANNLKESGHLLPWNDSMINTSLVHPRDPEAVSFISFLPLQYVSEPLVKPGQIHSFWTLIYSGMWVDNEPKFTFFTDPNQDWWRDYTSWETGEAPFPSAPSPISTTTRVISTGLLLSGLLPLCLIFIGLARCALLAIPGKNPGPVDEAAKFQIFPLILAFNTVGIILLVLKAPVYSSMKASYFLNSLPSFVVFIALSVQFLGNKTWVKAFIHSVVCVIAVLTSLYALRIDWALSLLK